MYVKNVMRKAVLEKEMLTSPDFKCKEDLLISFTRNQERDSIKKAVTIDRKATEGQQFDFSFHKYLRGVKLTQIEQYSNVF